MTDVGQALLGYQNGGGHRLLISSEKLDNEATRILRTASDMAFSGQSEHYLTVLPLPSVGMQAFIRTWRADWLRPGSVWSHALLLDIVSLAQPIDGKAILRAFRRPMITDLESLTPELDVYSKQTVINTNTAISPPDVDPNFASAILAAAYQSLEPGAVQGQSNDATEETLLALYFQQWPRLRRSFSLRTRAVKIDSGWRPDLEVVEKLRVETRHESQPEEIDLLQSDLFQPGPLRRFLQRYGAESDRGRLDMLPFVDVQSALTGGDESRVIEFLSSAFPAPEDMRLLKRDLFGAARTDNDPVPNWKLSEPARIALALENASIVDLGDLDIGKRLLRAAISGDDLGPLVAIHFERVPKQAVEVILDDVLTSADDRSVLRIALAQPDLGLVLGLKRPALLGYPELWETEDDELLSDILSQASVKDRRAVLDRLADQRAVAPLSAICSRQPQEWWALLFQRATPKAPIQSLVKDAEILRQVLDRIGSAALDAPPAALSPSQVALLTLLSADMSAGLWRRLEYSELSKLARNRESMPRYAQDRANAALLLKGMNGGSEIRQKAWLQAFPYLHEAMKSDRFDAEAWRVLAPALPVAPSWDRCLSLRHGVVSEIRRDHWQASSVQTVITAAGGQGREIEGALRNAARKTKKRSWLQEIIDAFRL